MSAVPAIIDPLGQHQGELAVPNDSRAGQPAERSDLVDVARLVTAYYSEHPDPSVPDQRVSFGISGHRSVHLSRRHAGVPSNAAHTTPRPRS